MVAGLKELMVQCEHMRVSQKEHHNEVWINGRKRRWFHAFMPSSLKYNRPLLLLMIGIFVLVSAIPLSLLGTPRAEALSNRGPDPSDFIDSSGNQVQVAYQLDTTTFATVTSLSILVYFTNNSSNTMSIHSPGLTELGVFDTVYGSSNISGNPVVTTFTVQRINADGSVGSTVKSATSRRNDSATLPIVVPNGSLVVDPITKYYIAQLTVTINTGYNDIANAFWVSSGGAGDYIGGDSKSAATSFAMQAPRNLGKYVDWNIRFGADCTVQSNVVKELEWFDADNGIDPIQPNKFSFTLFDQTAGANVVFQSLSGSDGSVFGNAANTVVVPGSGSKRAGKAQFIAKPYHKYIWRFNNVFAFNVLQFKRPFNDIYYKTDGCPRFTVNPDITGMPAFFKVGTTYTLSATGYNAGPDPSQPFNMKVTKTGGASYPVVTGTTSKTTTNSQLSTGLTFSYNFFVTFDIANPPPDGQMICFTNTVVPSNEKNATASLQRCAPFRRTFIPSVIGRGSDVHAGSGVCGPTYIPPASGFIKGQGDSKGEYVVSARTTVTSFGSNASSASPKTSIANYVPQTLCRPNLVNVASKFIGLHPSEVIKPAGVSPYTYSLDSLNALDLLNNKGVIYFPGNVTISGGTGIVSRKLTIYATGNITINSNIRLAGGTSVREDQPSLGLIAGGDINIAGAATQVDAYMFSNGVINTCYTAVATCNNTLNVRGFLMSKTLQLRRLGPLN